MRRSKFLAFVALVFIALPSFAAPVVLEWWGEFTGFEAKGTENAVAKWNATHPNIQVKYTGMPDLDKKVLAAVRAGNPPSVVSVGDNQNYPQFVASGMYTQLDSLINAAKFKMDTYWQPWTNRAMMVEGKIYGLPCTDWVEVLIYNKAMFKAAGLDPEKPPRTIAEFTDAQRKLTKRDAKGNITQMGISFRTTFPVRRTRNS
jgi:multiple sugar transport system substrate-binding protein